jgi:hypothetical protein
MTRLTAVAETFLAVAFAAVILVAFPSAAFFAPSPTVVPRRVVTTTIMASPAQRKSVRGVEPSEVVATPSTAPSFTQDLDQSLGGATSTRLQRMLGSGSDERGRRTAAALDALEEVENTALSKVDGLLRRQSLMVALESPTVPAVVKLQRIEAASKGGYLLPATSPLGVNLLAGRLLQDWEEWIWRWEYDD